jgi:hypothetical protein
MAFGGLRGTLVGGNNSIPNPLPATGSVAVVVGDLVVALIAQQTALTVTAVTDNLGNTYTAQNAGTLASTTISGRMFYSRVTVAGTLTTVNAATTSSTNDASISAAVYEGPFKVSPLDASPTNLTADTTTPYSCPATGTLAQADELCIGWFAAAGNATFTAGGGFTKSIQQSQSANAATAICALVVAATTTQTPSWTGTAPSNDVLGTASFRKDTGVAVGAASSQGAAAAAGQSTAATTGAASGVGAAAAVAPNIRATVSWLEIEAAQTATGTALGAAAGAGAGAAIGAALSAATGAASGNGSAAGAALAIFQAVGAGAGKGAAAAVGSANFIAVGSAAGAGAASGAGSTAGVNVGSGAGAGTATALSYYLLTTASTLTPDADDTDGGWTNELGGTTLYTSIDEAGPPNDSDYIISSDRPASDICKIRLSNPAGAIQAPFAVFYRFKKSGPNAINLRVRVLEGSTQITSWTHTDIAADFLSVEQVLSGPELASIGDPTNLYLEFRASV